MHFSACIVHRGFLTATHTLFKQHECRVACLSFDRALPEHKDKTRSCRFAFPPSTHSIHPHVSPSLSFHHSSRAHDHYNYAEWDSRGRWRALQRSRVLHSEVRKLKYEAVRFNLAWFLLWLLHHNRTLLRFVTIIAAKRESGGVKDELLDFLIAIFSESTWHLVPLQQLKGQ